MVSNPAPVISIAATGQDANFETRLNAMENAIFKLGSTLEKFISTNNPTGRSRGEKDRGYLTDFSVNASQSEIDQSSDDESNCGPPPQKQPSKNAVNIDICRVSKMYLTRTLISWFQMQKSRNNQGKRTGQQMI